MDTWKTVQEEQRNNRVAVIKDFHTNPMGSRIAVISAIVADIALRTRMEEKEENVTLVCLDATWLYGLELP